MAEMKARNLEQAKGNLDSIEQKVLKVHDALNDPNIEFEDISELEGTDVQAKDASFLELRTELENARKEVAFYDSIQKTADAIKGRRDMLNGEEYAPPAELDSTALTGRDKAGMPTNISAEKSPATLFEAWYKENAQELSASAQHLKSSTFGTKQIDLGDRYLRTILPEGSRVMNTRLDAKARFGTEFVTTTSGAQTGSAVAATNVEGTRPVFLQTTLPNPHTAAIDLVSTLIVPAIDNKWWVEDDRVNPAIDDADVGEGNTAHVFDLTGGLQDVRIVRKALEIKASKMALNNGVQLERIIFDRLPNAMNNVLDDEVINGLGTGEQFRGIRNWNGFSTSVADIRNVDLVTASKTAGTANISDDEIELVWQRVQNAITQVMQHAGGAMPNTTLIDFGVYDRLLTARDSDGRPLVVENFAQGIPGTIRGLPLIPSSRFGTSGEINDNQQLAIVADWNTCLLLIENASTDGGVVVSETNSDNQSRGLVSFIYERNAAFIIENAAAVCTITRS